MIVKFWGVRGSIATPGPETERYGGNTSCVSVQHGSTTIILDAGTGIRKLGLTLMKTPELRRELHLLISHTHWDHIQGFPFFAPAFVPGTVLHIYGPTPSEKPLMKVLAGQMDSEYFPVAMGDLAARLVLHEVSDVPFSIDGFTVTSGYLNHPGITVGYRLEADGGILTYAPDTEPFRRLLAAHQPTHGDGENYGACRDEELVRLTASSDLAILDSQYTPEEYAAKRGWGHSSYEDTVHLALEAKVRRLALFHHDPMHDDSAIERKESEARRIAESAGSSMEIFAAREGECVTPGLS